jgi:hypothetical protein
VAEAVNVDDWPLQIVAGFAVSDKSVGNGFTVTVAALVLVAEHPAAVRTNKV